MEDLVAHLLQRRQHLGERLLVAAAHDGERAVLGLELGPGHRRVDHIDLVLLQG